MSTLAPIGVFDSGLGGLSIAREIHCLLPEEALLYFADTARCPYGGRPEAEIRARSLDACEELVRRGAKLIVVACNTASGAALEDLRAALPVPIVGMEPAVKPAVERSRSGRVGVLATAGTVASERFRRLVTSYGAGAQVNAIACPGLVEMVERGETGGDAVQARLLELLEPLRCAGVDTVVLGCTHFPFLAEAIRTALGPEVRLLDSGAAVARQTERVLTERGLRASGAAAGLQLLTTGDPASVRPVAERLWGGPVQIRGIVLPERALYHQRTSGAPPSGVSSR